MLTFLHCLHVLLVKFKHVTFVKNRRIDCVGEGSIFSRLFTSNNILDFASMP